MLSSGGCGWQDHNIILHAGSFERKLCAFSFPFNYRTSEMVVVLSVKQKARPVELRDSGGQNGWIVEGKWFVIPSVISHRLQSCHQTPTGRLKLPKCIHNAVETGVATLKFGYFLSSSSNSRSLSGTLIARGASCQNRTQTRHTNSAISFTLIYLWQLERISDVT